MAQTIPGGAYLLPDGETWVNANGKPIPAPKGEIYIRPEEEPIPAPHPVLTGGDDFGAEPKLVAEKSPRGRGKSSKS